MPELHFEQFVHKRVHKPNGPMMSLWPSGKLQLTDEAARMIHYPDQVVIMWDADNRAIGVRAAKKGEGHGYALRAPGNGTSSRLVSVGCAMAHYGISVEEPVRAAPKLAGNVLYIRLPKEAVNGAVR